jgi:hypothetical protein
MIEAILAHWRALLQEFKVWMGICPLCAGKHGRNTFCQAMEG